MQCSRGAPFAVSALVTLASLVACEASPSSGRPTDADEGADASSASGGRAGDDAARDPEPGDESQRDARSDRPRDTNRDGGGPSRDARVDGQAAPDDGAMTCETSQEQKFSFFMISLRAVQRESGSVDGFGGDLGGITGADAICQRVAQYSSPCQESKVWRAFLSTTKEHAIDRIGTGPWYDRTGRLFANTIADLLHDRPRGADPQIVNDLPNEDGVPNRNPDGTGLVDNHQTLTGSGADGKLYGQGSNPGGGGGGWTTACANGEQWTREKATCWDWTSAKPEGCPRVGHSWPRQGSGINWISVGNEGGCAPGGELTERGGLDGTRRVGSAGGYGGFYCFALNSP